MPTITKILHPEAISCNYAADKSICLCRSCGKMDCAPCHNPKSKWWYGCELYVTKCNNYRFSPYIRSINLNEKVTYNGV